MSRLHFIGIKGSGMSSLALICHDLGYEVSGSDVDQFLFTEVALKNKHIPVLSFSSKNIVDGLEVIIGNAFDATNVEVASALANETVKTHTYYDFLSNLMNRYVSVAIAGSHGKTTTTGMVQSLLSAYLPTGYLIGDGHGLMTPQSEFFVVEACEYKNHFLHYFPQYAIISNIDLDHVDFFKNIEQYLESFQKFIAQVGKGVVINGDDAYLKTLQYSTPQVMKFGFEITNDVYATNIRTVNHQTVFDLHVLNTVVNGICINALGKHNVLNTLSAVALALMVGMPLSLITEHLSDFKGVARRFNVEDFDNVIYIDDYAHHPTEIIATIEACRSSYPDITLNVIYKPDRVSRVKYFEKEFKTALLKADKAFVLDFPVTAYAEDPNYSLAEFLQAMGDKIEYLSNDRAGAHQLSLQKDGVYLFVSPKDIYKFKELLKKEFNHI